LSRLTFFKVDWKFEKFRKFGKFRKKKTFSPTFLDFPNFLDFPAYKGTVFAPLVLIFIFVWF